MNICYSNTNTSTTMPDESSTNSFIDSPALQIQMLMGIAVIVVNIILVIWFTKKRQFTETTFVFLINLGISDILVGVLTVLKIIAIAIASNQAQILCRGIVGGTALSVIMSAMCILLISTQVSMNHTFPLV